jgi:tRNA-dependent cyclodipeptide synthase
MHSPYKRDKPGDKIDFKVAGQTENCNVILQKIKHVMLGISPFNSRFSTEYIQALIGWAADNFERVDLLLPSEEEATRLLVAAGTPPVKAARRTRQEVARRLRACEAAIAMASPKTPAIRPVQFFDFKDVPAYNDMYEATRLAFENCEVFRSACLTMSNQAVNAKLSQAGELAQPLPLEVATEASKYVFAELPYILDSPAILGVESSVFLYHRPWPIAVELFAGEFPLRISARQGFAVVTPTQPI